MYIFEISSFSAWFPYHGRRILKMVCHMHDSRFGPWALIFLGVHPSGMGLKKHRNVLLVDVQCGEFVMYNTTSKNSQFSPVFVCW